MAIFLVGSDLHDIQKNRQAKSSKNLERHKRKYSPLVSVLVPAHNEELTLRRNLDSVLNSTYKNIELIIVNDSSTDRTYNIARYFQKRNKHHFKRIKIINVSVRGKAKALNEGLKFTQGSLFMCLDADSALATNALELAVSKFTSDTSLACLSSNVKIFPGKGMLNFFQRLEYLVCYQMKKTESIANIQYIVGGIGSMFRTRIVKKLGNYDTDTITEDIDLSMKIISHYGSRYKVGYFPEVITYTEAVLNVKGLLIQRFRWKYGRYQVFLKHKHMFWSTSKKYSKTLSWLYLPYALVSEIFYLVEPLIIILIGYLIIEHSDATIVAASFVVFVFYTTMHVSAATKGYGPRERLKFISGAPLAYLGMYVLAFVEYVATVRGFFNIKKLVREYRNGGGVCEWKHVERKGTAVVV